MNGACVISTAPIHALCGWHPTRGCTRPDCDLRALPAPKSGAEAPLSASAPVTRTQF